MEQRKAFKSRRLVFEKVSRSEMQTIHPIKKTTDVSLLSNGSATNDLLFDELIPAEIFSNEK